jgi:hypothetical protein
VPAIVETTSATPATDGLALRLAAAEAEFAGLKALLAEVQANRDDMRADRDQVRADRNLWRHRAAPPPPPRPWWQRLFG